MRGRLLSLLTVLFLGTSAAAAADGTQAFLSQAAALNRFQIASGHLAVRKSQSAVVHGFAHQMILDYSAAGMKLRQAAADARLPLRDVLDERHKALLDRLTHTPPGKTLSRAYLETEETVLRDDLAVFQGYAGSGDNERLKVFAQEMVPVLSGHLEQLGKLRR
jgi:putative membrane protein